MLKDVLFHHWFTRWVLVPVLILYLLLLLFAATCADSVIFANHPAHYEDSSDILKLTTTDGVKISARYLPNSTAAYTILYSHGNGEDLGDDAQLLENLNAMGFAVFSYDYHGYGTSQGTPNETNTYRDIDAAYAYLTTELHIPAQRIILYGRSLGGGPAIDLAARKPAAGLVVQSTFATAYRAFTRMPLVPFDEFRNIDKIGRVRCPVLVIHGMSDGVVPFAQGRRLLHAVHSPKRHLWVPGAGHNNLQEVAGDRYPMALQEFVGLLDAK